MEKTNPAPPQKAGPGPRQLKRICGVAAAIAAVIVCVLLVRQRVMAPVSGSSAAPAAAPEASASSSLPEEAIQTYYYEQDSMFLTAARLDYADGDLVLRIPTLGLDLDVVGAFDDETRETLRSGAMTEEELNGFFSTATGDELLKAGVVLLNNATLPAPDILNANVSISGHRDIEGREFLNIHLLGEGDLFYLEYGGREYTYEYLATEIRSPDDWTITHCGGENLLTLISCDPIGTSLTRIVVTARLVESRDL